MTLDEFKALPDQKAWLEEQTGSLGRSVDDILEELAINRQALTVLGFTFALGSWYFMSNESRKSVNAQS